MENIVLYPPSEININGIYYYRNRLLDINKYLNNNPLLSHEEVLNSINLTDSKISFDWSKIGVDFQILISYKYFNQDFTAGEILSILFHEIFHRFADYIIPQNKMNSFSNENFADQGPILLGYGKEYSKFILKDMIHLIQDKYKEMKTNSDLSDEEIIGLLDEFILNIPYNKKLNFSDDDPHLHLYLRIQQNLKLLFKERKNNSLPMNKKLEIENDIKAILLIIQILRGNTNNDIINKQLEAWRKTSRLRKYKYKKDIIKNTYDNEQLLLDLNNIYYRTKQSKRG